MALKRKGRERKQLQSYKKHHITGGGHCKGNDIFFQLGTAHGVTFSRGGGGRSLKRSGPCSREEKVRAR